MTLVPPPPPDAPSITAGRSNVDTPARKAFALMKQGNFAEAETALRKIVQESPLDLHSRYLLAVALVQRRKFQEARGVYKFVVDHAQDTRLVELAAAGLRKLD